MDFSKSTSKVLYEEVRLLAKDSLEAISRLKRICIDCETQYVFINDHIGDVVISLGYLSAFKESNNINHLTIITTEKYSDYVKNYSDVIDEMIFIESYELYRIFLLNSTRYGHYYILKRYTNVTFVNPADLSLLGFNYFKRFPELTLEKLIRYGAFSLNTESTFISINEKRKRNQNVSFNKRVLFSTTARTEVGDITVLCEKLVPYFLKRGYEVYTNTKDEGKTIKGTNPLLLGLDEICDYFSGGIFIGIRSGLHDLLAYYECKMIALYFSDEKSISFFSIGMLPNITSKFLEFIPSEDYQGDCNKIISFIETTDGA